MGLHHHPAFDAPILGLNSVTRHDVSDGRVGTGSNIHCAHSIAAFFNKIVDWKPFEHYTVLQSGVAGLEYYRTIHLEPGGTGTHFTVSVSQPDKEDPKGEYDFQVAMLR